MEECEGMDQGMNAEECRLIDVVGNKPGQAAFLIQRE